MTAGDRAWLALIVGITAWEIHALRTDPDQLLSRRLDIFRARHPAANIAALGIITTTAAHLARAVPGYLDVYSLVS